MIVVLRLWCTSTLSHQPAPAGAWKTKPRIAKKKIIICPTAAREVVHQLWLDPWDALEGKGPQRQPQKRSDRRLEEVAKAVGGGYCRLQMPLKLALGVRGAVAGCGLGALEGGG